MKAQELAALQEAGKVDFGGSCGGRSLSGT